MEEGKRGSAAAPIIVNSILRTFYCVPLFFIEVVMRWNSATDSNNIYEYHIILFDNNTIAIIFQHTYKHTYALTYHNCKLCSISHACVFNWTCCLTHFKGHFEYNIITISVLCMEIVNIKLLSNISKQWWQYVLLAGCSFAIILFFCWYLFVFSTIV